MFSMNISIPALAADDMAPPAEAPTMAPAPDAPTIAPTADTDAALPSFNKVDVDGNGTISTAEASAVPGLIDRFATADTDRSGDLSKAEYAKLSHS
jgi:hypothetical protein